MNSGGRGVVALAVGLAVLVSACSSSAEPLPDVDYIIMPAGDNITTGTDGDNAYRCLLWQKLAAAGRSVAFAGPQTGQAEPCEVPAAGAPFMPNHTGRPGATVADFLDELDRSEARRVPPDVALVHIGTNNIWSDLGVWDLRLLAIEEDLVEVVEVLRRMNPEVTILLAELIPCAFPTLADGITPLCGTPPAMALSRIFDINTLVKVVATLMDTSTSRVIAVDHNTGFDPLPPPDGADLKADGVNPSPIGAEKMADVWLAALEEHVFSLPPPRAGQQPDG